MQRLLALVLISITLAGTSRAQGNTDTTRGVGIAASFQNEQLDIILPMWLGESFVLAPGIGLVMSEDLGTDIRVAVMGRYYFRNGVIAPYIGPKLGAMLFSPENGASTVDVLAGAMLGGEYFLHPQFSLGVEMQLNVVFSDDASTRFGNPGKVNVNTGSAVYATLYF